MQKSVYLTFLISSLDIVLLYSWEIRDIHILKVDSRCQIFMRTTIHYAMKALWQHWLWSFNFRKQQPIFNCVIQILIRDIYVVNISIMRDSFTHPAYTYHNLHWVQFFQSFSSRCIFIGYPVAAQRYTYWVLQTIQIKFILSCVWAERAVLGSAKTALKFKHEI